jgi:hypothetical protein
MRVVTGARVALVIDAHQYRVLLFNTLMTTQSSWCVFVPRDLPVVVAALTVVLVLLGELAWLSGNLHA